MTGARIRATLLAAAVTAAVIYGLLALSDPAVLLDSLSRAEAAPLVAAGAFLLVRRPGPALLRVLAPPALAWGFWGAYTASLYGSVHFLGSTDVVVDRSFEPDEFWNQVVSTPVYYGCALVFPIALWLASLLRGRRGTELAEH